MSSDVTRRSRVAGARAEPLLPPRRRKRLLYRRSSQPVPDAARSNASGAESRRPPAAVRCGDPGVDGYLAIGPRITASPGTPAARGNLGNTSSTPDGPHRSDGSSSCDTYAPGTPGSAA